MSLIDKALAAVTPIPSQEAREKATLKARQAASAGDWLSLALDHHEQIRTAFAAGREAKSAPERIAAMKALALVLNGHSLAEELVLYPALGQSGEKLHAAQAYLEQTTAKAQMAELENIAPSKPAWLDKWGHIEGAVLTHMYEEEGDWFLKLKEKGENQARLTARYAEEFERYVG
ncbi:MAG TPA: hemerythrin domain-containing protein [Brevundimonas sp.]|jgi:hypothetical protein